MKLPTKCPVCGGNFMFEFFGSDDKFIKLSCVLKSDHRIVFKSGVNSEDANTMCITISLDKQVKVQFLFNSQIILIGKGPDPSWVRLSQRTGKLPWFEPDLSDYAKLINKLKTYVLFT